jgi:hypothetical protein
LLSNLRLELDTEPKFEFEAVFGYLDEAKETPRFESNKKKFWILCRNPDLIFGLTFFSTRLGGKNISIHLLTMNKIALAILYS